MITEAFHPEVFAGIESLFLYSIGVLGAITFKQREFLLKVWNNKCQGRNIGMKHKCGNDIQLHHIIPQGWAYEHLGEKRDEVDGPYRIIPLCGDAHTGARGTQDCIHPDQMQAADDFRNGDRDAYTKIQQRRTMMAQTGVVYWNTKWDNNMLNLVRNKIDKHFRNHGEAYPIPNHKNGVKNDLR